jgi:hypothetical protein
MIIPYDGERANLRALAEGHVLANSCCEVDSHKLSLLPKDFGKLCQNYVLGSTYVSPRFRQNHIKITGHSKDMGGPFNRAQLYVCMRESDGLGHGNRDIIVGSAVADQRRHGL